jgi:hypothetical protein
MTASAAITGMDDRFGWDVPRIHHPAEAKSDIESAAKNG